MSTSNNPQKLAKPLARPTSGQQKKASVTSTMEVLPPEERKTITDFSKPLSSVKKEIKLERTGSAATKKTSNSVMSSTEVSGFNYPSERDLMSQSVRSNINSNQVQEDLKKLSSKPSFGTKSKKKTSVVESTELNQSTKSTNIDGSQQHLSTPGTDVNVSTSQALLSIRGEDEYAKQRLDFSSANVDDLLMYDADDYKDNEKEEENIEVNINFEELHKKFEEMANRQKEIEMIANDYVTHLLNAKSDTGETLVKFPKNFQEIVDNTVEQTKTMEDLKDKGIVSDEGIQRFIREQMRANLNESKKKEEKKEDPYAKEKAKIKENDRILAQIEREIRLKKDMEKMKRMQDLEEFDEHEISTEDIDKIFLTEWQKKRKSGVSTAQVSAQKSKRQEEEKVVPIKPKMFTGKNHIKKNIQGAFSKAKESLISKLSEKDQQRLEHFMQVINKMLDNEGDEDDLLKQVIPNPYELGGGDAYRMQEIDQRMALLSLDQNIKGDIELPEKNLPKDKALRDQAEKRALEERDQAITKKLMEMNNKEKLNEVYDSNIIIALAEKLKKENADFNSNRKKGQNEEDDVLEKQFKEAVTALSGFDTDEMLKDLESLSSQTQSVQKRLKNVMDSINKGKSQEDQAKEEKYKSDLLRMYSTRKEKLNYLESDTVQSDFDALTKLEKNLFKAERDVIEGENRLMTGVSYVAPEYAPEHEKTAEDYDREFTEKLRLQNPELFANMPDGEEEDIDIKYKNVIIEEWQAEDKEDDIGDENQEPQ